MCHLFIFQELKNALEDDEAALQANFSKVHSVLVYIFYRVTIPSTYTP
jgi:hypothetical protein